MLGMKTADQGYEEEVYDRPIKKPNTLSLWGNEKTMNLNTLVLTNIQSSQYFRVNLYELKTYHEVVDEIYYQVTHLEPWEKGSRKTSGQTGMCGGVRGVGAGGIVSTAFCILYKLFTLKLTRKQVQGLMNHRDSPYIRGLGFMYVRYTQPPADLWDWFEPYFDDEEEIDARAGGGQPTTIGVYVRQMLTKLDWFSTLFPRIPVPIQKEIDRKLGEREREHQQEQYSSNQRNYNEDNDRDRRTDDRNGDYQRDRTDRNDRQRQRSSSLDRDRGRDKYRENDRQSDRDRGRDKHMDRDRHADKGNDRHGRRERDERKEKDRPKHRDRSRERERDRYYDHHHSSSSGGHRDRMGGDRYSYELEREKERIRREKKRSRSTSRSKDRHRKHRTH